MEVDLGTDGLTVQMEVDVVTDGFVDLQMEVDVVTDVRLYRWRWMLSRMV